MEKNNEKLLSFDKFKEKVYKNIGTLESMEEMRKEDFFDSANQGCFGFLAIPVVKRMNQYGITKHKEIIQYNSLKEKADKILAQKEIKDLLCKKLEVINDLPIDISFKITPVLYELALKDEEKIPFNSMLFAILSQKIAQQGVIKFCAVE